MESGDKIVFSIVAGLLLTAVAGLAFAIIAAMGSDDRPCEDFANTSMRYVPARCISHFEDGQ